MSGEAFFCPACGAPTRFRDLEGRLRRVCSACARVAWRNPLPVAAAVVVDGQQRLLLVHRERPPRQGMWCLPIGFAERGESIEQAALRELREEAGVEGRIRRLLDVGSHPSDTYGDLLVVTYEVTWTGGRARGGDDADAARWFPLSELPPLAFTSNQRALEAWYAWNRPPFSPEPGAGPADPETMAAQLHHDAAALAHTWWLRVQAEPGLVPLTGRGTALRDAATEALIAAARVLEGDPPGPPPFGPVPSPSLYRALALLPPLVEGFLASGRHGAAPPVDRPALAAALRSVLPRTPGESPPG